MRSRRQQTGRSVRVPVSLAVGCALLVCAVRAAALDFGAPVRASLWSEQDGIAPGRPFTLGLRLLHAPGWHSYWIVPGDAGLPTRLTWRLPPGFRAGPIQWPAPRRLQVGPLVDYGYEGHTLLLTDLQPGSDLSPGGEVRIEAKAQWLMCRDVCIPGSQDLAITLPVRDAGALHATAEAPAFERARSHIPRERSLASAAATLANGHVTLQFALPAQGAPHRLEFFPLEAGRIEPSAPQKLRVDVDRVQLDLTAAQPVAADFYALRGVLAADGGLDAGGWAGTIDVPINGSSRN